MKVLVIETFYGKQQNFYYVMLLGIFIHLLVMITKLDDTSLVNVEKFGMAIILNKVLQ